MAFRKIHGPRRGGPRKNSRAPPGRAQDKIHEGPGTKITGPAGALPGVGQGRFCKQKNFQHVSFIWLPLLETLTCSFFFRVFSECASVKSTEKRDRKIHPLALADHLTRLIFDSRRPTLPIKIYVGPYIETGIETGLETAVKTIQTIETIG